MLGLQWAAASVDVQYQDRGDRFEGIRYTPVASASVELLSARIESNDAAASDQRRVEFGFWLPRSEGVHVTMREISPRTYYWLDRVKPKSGWKAGFNTFSWPADAVISHIDALTLDDLGIVVRRGSATASSSERISPATLGHPPVESHVTGYVFTFVADSDIRVRCTVTPTGGNTAVVTRMFNRQPGNRPFSVHFKASALPQGAYRLLLSGFVIETNDSIDQTVEFYHPGAPR
jgi:hypothetical protein